MILTREKSEKYFFYFLIAITIVNLVQSCFMEITEDEAYYFQYAKDLDWGYYDHPPMVALLIKISQLFFSGNLGIRLFSVLLFSGNLLLVWKFLLPENKHHFLKEFIFLSLGLIMFNAYAFIMTPDVPLLFFTTVFFIMYKNFLTKENYYHAILLGISVALMMYSKYHSVLLVFFVILSNLKILKKPSIFLAGMAAAILLIPHLLWHVKYDFPSFQYHLSDRSGAFKMKYFLEYIPNQFLILNPFILIPFVLILFKNKFREPLEKAYFLISSGFLIFFALTSLRGHVEPHWTVIISIPLLLIFFKKTTEELRWRKYVHRYVLGSLLLVFIARILILLPIFSDTFKFSGKEEKYVALQKKIGNVPVIFTGSFQPPSLYNYFTGNEATTLGSLNVRKTQYDIWQREQDYFGKKVFVEKKDTRKSVDVVAEEDYCFTGFFLEDFQTPNRLQIDFELNNKVLTDQQTISIDIFNPTKNKVNFNHKEIPVAITAVFLNGKKTKHLPSKIQKLPEIIKPGERYKTNIKIDLSGINPGEYFFGITTTCILGNAHNSPFVKVKVR